MSASTDPVPNASYVYKIMPLSMWEEANSAEGKGLFTGSDDDVRDGFIHLSQAHQVPRTLGRFYVGQKNLVVIKVPISALAQAGLASALKFEFGVPRPEGADANHMFPHLFASLPLTAVSEVIPVPEKEDGSHGELVLDT
eukprot:GILI01005398.1.p2 GENE.GILI01005398.1~~GILI01005398.1.p2  ORF type:complete len:140 (-),score=26.80 GILI01005398.1:1220-1639(-)